MASLEPRRVEVEYLEQPCKTALNRVKGMPFNWSLNPYMGCEHRCAFCYVRFFERRADRASDHRYGRAIRVKTNVAQVLRQEDDVHCRLIAFIETAPDEQATGDTRFRRRLRLDTYGHYPKHAHAIRSWREQRSTLRVADDGLD